MKRKETILITGGAGFIGTHLSAELRKHGYHVRILDPVFPQAHGGNASLSSPTGQTFIKGDICSSKTVRKALVDVDAVFHFAAAPGARQSMDQIRTYVETHTLGTSVLLEELARRPVKRLIVASGMGIYGEGLYETSDGQRIDSATRTIHDLRSRSWEPRDERGRTLKAIPTPETKMPRLSSLYDLTKYDQEQMCLIFGRALDIPCVALRFFNVYGPGQALHPHAGVLGVFASCFLNHSPPQIFEDGNQRRDFVHVSDAVEACRLALSNPEVSDDVFNVGSGGSFSVLHVAEQLADALGRSALVPEVTGRYRAGDVRHCFADISKIKSVLGFQPRVPLAQGLENFARWLEPRRVASLSRDDYRGLNHGSVSL